MTEIYNPIGEYMGKEQQGYSLFDVLGVGLSDVDPLKLAGLTGRWAGTTYFLNAKSSQKLSGTFENKMVEPSLSKRESARRAKLVLDSPLIELATPSVFSSAGDKKLHPSQSPTIN
jgi:hypothetical protein